MAEPTLLETRYRDDPNGFAVEVLNIAPREFQPEILRLVAGHPRVAVAAARNVGKTTAAAIAALWWLCTRPGCLVAVAAPTWRQVSHFMTALRSLWQRSKLPGLFPSWEMLQDELRTTLADWRLIAMSAEQGERVEGAHGRADIMVVCDEARGIPDGIFASLVQMTGGHEDARVLAISTPGGSVGWFFDCFTRFAEQWRTLTISAKDVPRLARHYAQQLAEQGDSAFFQQQLGGRFADVSEGDGVFDLSAVQEAMSRTPFRWDMFSGAGWPTIVGFDPSGKGGDFSVAAARRGPNVEGLHVLGREQDEMLTISKLVALVERLRAQRVVVDAAGMGSVFASRLEQIYGDPLRRRVQVVPFIANATAEDSERWSGAKAEVAFRLRQRLLARGEAPSLTLPRHDRLLADLTSYRWTTDSRGRSRLVDPPRSPDFGDAVLLTFARGRQSVAWLD